MWGKVLCNHYSPEVMSLWITGAVFSISEKTQQLRSWGMSLPWTAGSGVHTTESNSLLQSSRVWYNAPVPRMAIWQESLSTPVVFTEFVRSVTWLLSIWLWVLVHLSPVMTVKMIILHHPKSIFHSLMTSSLPGKKSGYITGVCYLFWLLA